MAASQLVKKPVISLLDDWAVTSRCVGIGGACGQRGWCGWCMIRVVVQRAVDGQAAAWVAFLASMGNGLAPSLQCRMLSAPMRV